MTYPEAVECLFFPHADKFESDLRFAIFGFVSKILLQNGDVLSESGVVYSQAIVVLFEIASVSILNGKQTFTGSKSLSTDDELIVTGSTFSAAQDDPLLVPCGYCEMHDDFGTFEDIRILLGHFMSWDEILLGVFT